jgi:predicted RNA methylase
LRSDLCRLNKLLDIPTVMAVDLEQTKAALKKSEKRNKILGEEVKMLKTKIDSMEKRIETLSH